MKTARWAILLLLVAPGGCAEGAGQQGTGLPEEFRGTWELVETSGGIAGAGAPMPEGERPRIVLTADNVLERRAPDGAVTREPFTLRRGKTIFSVEEQWILEFEEGATLLVVEIYPDGRLGMSENVFDGYSSSFRKVDE